MDGELRSSSIIAWIHTFEAEEVLPPLVLLLLLLLFC